MKRQGENGKNCFTIRNDAELPTEPASFRTAHLGEGLFSAKQEK